MQSYMWWYMGLSCLAAVMSVASALVAVTRSPSRRIAKLEVEVSDLHEAYETLYESHKRLRSREGMAELRARRKDADAPGSPRTRAAGKVAHPAGSRAALRQQMGVPDAPIALLNDNLKRNGLA